MARSVEDFQIPVEVAEAYEATFVPRLFRPWARHLVDFAAPRPGQRVLDVACGTGVVALEARARTAGRADVVGLDLNENMLAIARRLSAEIEWRRGDAGALPFEDRGFDLVLCQSGLMFFPDPTGALREMGRVVAADGAVALQVWDELAAQPAYAPFVEVAARHAGPDALDLLGTYWNMGHMERLTGRLRDAGLEVAASRTLVEEAPFASLDEFVATEVASTPLAQRLSPEAHAAILADARTALAAFRTVDGRARIPLRGHLVKARPA